jgi:hypothetical protein
MRRDLDVNRVLTRTVKASACGLIMTALVSLACSRWSRSALTGQRFGPPTASDLRGIPLTGSCAAIDTMVEQGFGSRFELVHALERNSGLGMVVGGGIRVEAGLPRPAIRAVLDSGPILIPWRAGATIRSTVWPSDRLTPAFRVATLEPIW